MPKRCALLICLLLPTLVALGQTNYYVSDADGNDLNDGSFLNPWKTIQKALFTIPFAEDDATIHIRTGTYAIADPLIIEQQRGGSVSNFFTLQNYNGESVIIDGSNILTFEAMLVIRNTQYVKIQGLEFSNLIGNNKGGIRIDKANSNIQILNNTLHNMHWSTNGAIPSSTDNLNPFIVLGDDATTPITDILISGNTVYDISPGYSEAVTITGNVDGFTLTNNEVYGIANIGIVAAGNYSWVGIPAAVNHARNGSIKNNLVYNCVSPVAISAGIYLDGAIDVLVENNVSHSNSVGFSIGCEQVGTSSGHILRNNVAYNNEDAGLFLGSNPASGTVENITVTGNTFYKNYTVGGFGGELTLQLADNVSIRNNIFYALNTVVLIASQNATNVTLDYNLYYNGNGGNGSSATFDWSGINGNTYGSFTTYQRGTGQDPSPSSAFADPLFTDGSLPDLHLTLGSPAIDQGDPAYTLASGETDIDGMARIFNSRVDIGADENDQVPAPITYLKALYAQRQKEGISLSWVTSEEINAAHFELEKSEDGQHWMPFHQIAAAGKAHPYRWLDSSPFSGINYYRLKQTDWDGVYQYSEVVSALWESENPKILLFPNPSSNTIFIKNNPPENTTLKIFNALGKEIRSLINASQIDDLPQGFYTIVLTTESGYFFSTQLIIY